MPFSHLARQFLYLECKTTLFTKDRASGNKCIVQQKWQHINIWLVTNSIYLLCLWRLGMCFMMNSLAVSCASRLTESKSSATAEGDFLSKRAFSWMWKANNFHCVYLSARKSAIRSPGFKKCSSGSSLQKEQPWFQTFHISNIVVFLLNLGTLLIGLFEEGCQCGQFGLGVSVLRCRPRSALPSATKWSHEHQQIRHL